MKDTLIALRTEKRYSQNALAKELGISRQAYIKYETGEVEPTVEIIRKLSKLFSVSYDILIDNKLNPTPSKNSILYTISDNEKLAVSSPTPSYNSSNVYNVTTLQQIEQIQTALSNLTKEQLNSLFTIVKSFKQSNKNNSDPQSISIKKRTPGGLSGQLWMSEDFDQPLDDFRDYM